ncbi:hypothetical protein ACFXKC_42365 [Streptomyces sp. NPDC059340]|uniref:hypothetical protein n=1 Tax=Streptomyces sp. NPDC059340 TaxID=3346806 RepID=UPI0036C8109B
MLGDEQWDKAQESWRQAWDLFRRAAVISERLGPAGREDEARAQRHGNRRDW